MAKELTVYKCEYCGAYKERLNIAIRHEKACLSNPKSQNCLNCEHSKKEYEYANEGSYESRFCSKLRKSCSRAVSGGCKEYEFKRLERFDIEISDIF